jgi:hypothetical protein
MRKPFVFEHLLSLLGQAVLPKLLTPLHQSLLEPFDGIRHIMAWLGVIVEWIERELNDTSPVLAPIWYGHFERHSAEGNTIPIKGEACQFEGLSLDQKAIRRQDCEHLRLLEEWTSNDKCTRRIQRPECRMTDRLLFEERIAMFEVCIKRCIDGGS